MQRITPLPPKVDDGARQGSADACYTPLESYEGLPLHRANMMNRTVLVLGLLLQL